MTETKIMSQGRRQIALFSSTGAGVCLGLAGVAAGLWLCSDPPRAPQLGRFEVPPLHAAGESSLAGPRLAGSPEPAASVRPATFSSSRSPVDHVTIGHRASEHGASEHVTSEHGAVERGAASRELSAGSPPVDRRHAYDRRQLYLETMQRVRSSHRTPAGEAPPRGGSSHDPVAADRGVAERTEPRFAAEQSPDRSSTGSPRGLGGRLLAAP